MRIQVEGIVEVLKSMIRVFPTTLSLAIATALIAFSIAIVFAICEYLEVKGTRKLIEVYTSFFRGTPLVAQLFFFYFGLPTLIPAFKSVSGYTSAVITMGLNNSAYIKEAIRGALSSVEKGQVEAGLSLGYTNKQVVRYIVFPQAALTALPSLSNSLVDILKGTSMAFVVGVIEMTAAAQLYSASTLRFFEGYAALILMYFFLVLILERILRATEKQLSKAMK